MKAKKGFTLLELLVVAIILGLLSVVIVQIFFTTIRTNNKTEIGRDVKGIGDRALEIMTRIVQNAKLIKTPISCPEYPSRGDPLGTITLVNLDGGETTLSCMVDGDVARIASTSAEPKTVYLTNTNVSLGDATTNSCDSTPLSFQCSAVGATPAFITISFGLRQKNIITSNIDAASQEFTTTVTIRNK